MSGCCGRWQRDLLCALGGVIVASAVLVPVGWHQVRAERERAAEAERQQAQAAEQARTAEQEAIRTKEALEAARAAEERAQRLAYAAALARAHEVWEQSNKTLEIAPPPRER
jgi:hypothetical protein